MQRNPASLTHFVDGNATLASRLISLQNGGRNY